MKLPLIDIVDIPVIDPRRFKRFEFGPKESFLLGQIIAECGPSIIRNREFAIPPFSHTYIEYDAVQLRAGTGQPIYGSEMDADKIGGFAAQDGAIFPMAGNPKGHGHGLFFYWNRFEAACPFNTKDLPSMRWENENGSPLAVVHLGSDSKSMSDDEHRAIVNEWGVHTLYVDRVKDKAGLAKIQDQWRWVAGELRVFWAAVLLLNRPNGLVEQVAVPHSSGLYKGKRRVYAAHTRVVLGAPRRGPLIKSLGLMERNAPRRHEVRGHFVHYSLGDRCEHDWEAATLEPIKRWKCLKCAGRRVWRAEFERGDAGKGYVTKDYTLGEAGTL